MEQDIELSLDEVNSLILEKQNELKELEKQKNDLLSKTAVECGECKTVFEIKDVTFIQTHWYERPHGCTGGDTWHQGEGQIKCPSCARTLRLYNHPEITALKHLFKNVEDTHVR